MQTANSMIGFRISWQAGEGCVRWSIVKECIANHKVKPGLSVVKECTDPGVLEWWSIGAL
jgi:hypothetical protein